MAKVALWFGCAKQSKNLKRFLLIKVLLSNLYTVIIGFGLGFGAFPVIIRDQVEKNLNLFDADSEGRKNFVRIIRF